MRAALLLACFTPTASLRCAVTELRAPKAATGRRSAVTCSALPDCPFKLPPCPFGSSSSSSDDPAGSATAPPPPPSAFEAATALEQRVQEALGVDTPLVCSALSLAIESVLTATADELGSLSVVFNASRFVPVRTPAAPATSIASRSLVRVKVRVRSLTLCPPHGRAYWQLSRARDERRAGERARARRRLVQWRAPCLGDRHRRLRHQAGAAQPSQSHGAAASQPGAAGGARLLAALLTG